MTMCLACLHVVSPPGASDQAAPPKPRRSPAQESPRLCLPPTSPTPPPCTPPIELTQSDSPEMEEAAPQCRFQMDCVSLSFTLVLSISSPEAALLVLCLLLDLSKSELVFLQLSCIAKPVCVFVCVCGNTTLCPHMLSISQSVSQAAELLSDTGSM